MREVQLNGVWQPTHGGPNGPLPVRGRQKILIPKYGKIDRDPKDKDWDPSTEI